MRVLAYLIPAMLYVALPLLLVASPQVGKPLLVIASPWSSPAETAGMVARAGGALLRGTPLPWIAVAISDGADFSDRLRQAGAWVTLDASRISACTKPPPA